MKAVILAGGFGTRLSEETDVIPKPMIEIGGRPLLWHLMKLYSAQGINEFVVALGYKGNMIKKYFLDYERMHSDLFINLEDGFIRRTCSEPSNWKVHLVDTGDNVMTGGRLLRLRHLLDEPFLLTYGDGLADISVKNLLDFHHAHGLPATVTAVRPPSRFGVLQTDSQDRVIHFAEKPKDNEEWINGGFFVLNPSVLDCIEGDHTSWEKEPCAQIAADGRMAAYRHHGFWQCIDTLFELRRMRGLWDAGEAPWKVW